MTQQLFTDTLNNKYNCQGIYAIKHTPSGKLYIGSSYNIRTRLNQHLNSLNNNKHHSRYLQNAWNKYNHIEFHVLVLETVSSRDELSNREQYWMDYFDSYKEGYNARPTAENFYGMEWSEEQNKARKDSNVLAWKNPDLRKNLSDKFKGKKRGVWTDESYKKQSDSLKKIHRERPELREKTRAIFSKKDIVEKRIEGVRRSLRDPNIKKARISQLKEASKSPTRVKNLQKSYFDKYDRSESGANTPEEFDALCIKLYSEGNSLRDIGKKLNIDHKSVSVRLKRHGITVLKRPKNGSKLSSSKLTEKDVIKIKEMLLSGMTQAKIAKRFKISGSVVSEINTGKAWKHVK